MNATILRAYRRGEFPTGGVGVLSGIPEPIARLNAAQNAFDHAKRSGDPEQKAYAEHLLDRAVEAARTARQEREQPRDEASGQFASFDSGFRGRRSVAPASGRSEPESASSLFARAMLASRAERAEREAAQADF
jgi:hypothetical protein